MINKQLLISIIFLVCTSSMHFTYAHYDHSDSGNEHCHTINEDNNNANTQNADYTGTDAQYKNTYEQDVNGDYLSEVKKRFSINPSSPGVIIDHQTKTMWYRCIFPGKYKNDACDQAGSPTINIVPGFDYTTDRSWYNAFKSALAANSFAYGDYTDWRLPNLNEISFIVDRACAKKAATDTTYNAFPTNFFLKYKDGSDSYYLIDSNGSKLDNSKEIWSATPKIFNEDTVSYTSYTVNFKTGAEDLKTERKVIENQKNVFVILMRSCKQEDGC